MKKITLLVLVAVAFAACQKSGTTSPKTTITPKDTIPEKGTMFVQLVKDSSTKDEIAIQFSKTYHLTYDAYEDNRVPVSSPPVLLSAIASDGTVLNWDGVPYTPGMSIALAANVTSSGPYFLKVSRLVNIPSNIQVWCKDNLLKDSLDIRKGNYHFNIDNADTNSFGKKRFQIVVR